MALAAAAAAHAPLLSLPAVAQQQLLGSAWFSLQLVADDAAAGFELLAGAGESEWCLLCLSWRQLHYQNRED